MRRLSDAHVGSSRGELVAQRNYSLKVVRLLAGSWRVAPRHSTCWAHVPWARVCDRGRRRLIAHRWLYRVASERFARLYPSRPAVDGCLGELIRRESGWRIDATNRSSGAYGLPQALPGSKMASAGKDWATNAATQIRWMLSYVARYGGSCGALAFQKRNGWY